MLKTVFTAMALVLGLSGFALAADVTGTWSGSMTMGDNQVTLTYNFKQDGEKLTGSVIGPGGNPLDLNEGKVEGDKISFFVQVTTPNGTLKISSKGAIKDEEITLNTTMEGMPDIPGGMPPMTLKRSK